MIALVLLLGGVRALISLRNRGRPAPPLAAAAHDPLAGMSMLELARAAAGLSRGNRPYESLPYYRRLATRIPPERVDFGLDFATALQSASLQARVRSEERVRLMRECFDELARVERAVRRPRDLARVNVARAFFSRVWGFPVDAVSDLRRALATDASYPDLEENLRLMERSVSDPTLPLENLRGPDLTY